MQLVQRLWLFDNKFDLILLEIVEARGHRLLSLVILFNFYLVFVGCDVSEHDGVPGLNQCLFPDEAWSQLLEDFVLNFVCSFLNNVSHDSLTVRDRVEVGGLGLQGGRRKWLLRLISWVDKIDSMLHAKEVTPLLNR